MVHGSAIGGEVVRRRLTLTAVRRRRFVTAGGSLGATRVPCPVCRAEVGGVTPEVASRLLRSDSRGLAALIANGTVHAIPAASGALWICRRSLFPGGTP